MATASNTVCVGPLPAHTVRLDTAPRSTMRHKQPGPQRSLQPRQGWRNIFVSQACGDAQFHQRKLYEGCNLSVRRTLP